MKKKVAALVSKAVLSIAKRSADSACDWLTYQPKVPQRLRNRKQNSST